MNQFPENTNKSYAFDHAFKGIMRQPLKQRENDPGRSQATTICLSACLLQRQRRTHRATGSAAAWRQRSNWHTHPAFSKKCSCVYRLQSLVNKINTEMQSFWLPPWRASRCTNVADKFGASTIYLQLGHAPFYISLVFGRLSKIVLI